MDKNGADSMSILEKFQSLIKNLSLKLLKNRSHNPLHLIESMII